jgi:hypothetical protein
MDSSKRTPAPGRRLRAAATGLAGAVAVALGGWGTAPAEAATGTVALCSQTSTGTFTVPVDPNGSDGKQSDRLNVTGTVSCRYADGRPMIGGRFTIAVALPDARCTGAETDYSSIEDVKWSDGTTSLIRSRLLDRAGVDGLAAVTSVDTVVGGTRFRGATVTSQQIRQGRGCGAASGETGNTGTGQLTITG